MSDGVLVSTRKGLFIVARRGLDRWEIARTSFLGDNVSLCLVDPRDGAWYAALDHGHFGVKLHRSEDRGLTWTEVGVPTYPEPPEGHVEKDWMGREIPWKLIRIWALEAGPASRPGELWAGTLPGGLFRSPDRGASWELIRGLWDHPDRLRWSGGGADYPGLHSICLDPRHPDWLAVGVSTGGAWFTRDAGLTWECRGEGLRADYVPPGQAQDPVLQDVHRLVQSPVDPATFWIQHHNGIFVTRDDAGRWEELKEAGPSVFGFPVVAHPKEPATAWFVPAIKDERRIPVGGSVVVTRTRDGGRTFDTLREGLPQEHAYDLVYRHALAIDGTGDRLAFGSTTGSLWISEDGGDRWHAVAGHLPPVYAVTFVP
jgi:hypothetical protein